MPSNSASDGVAQWFAYLQLFQSACSFNTSTVGITLLAFSKLKPSTALVSANQQANFCLKAIGSTGIPVSTTVLTAADSFLALLNNYFDLPTLVEGYLQNMAVAPYPAGTLTDFLNATAANAFPGGSGGQMWKAAVAGLVSGAPPAIEPSCFSAALQVKVAGLVDTAGTEMGAVSTQIAGLG